MYSLLSQFQHGAIKINVAMFLYYLEHFNSSMVRSKVKNELQELNKLLTFQFHCGSIKSLMHIICL